MSTEDPRGTCAMTRKVSGKGISSVAPSGSGFVRIFESLCFIRSRGPASEARERLREL